MLYGKWRPLRLRLNVLTHWGMDKIVTSLQIFQTYFLKRNLLDLIEISLKFVAEASNW